MNKVRWGIVSTGNIANQFASDFEYVKKGELVAVASRSLESAREFACKYTISKAYGTYEELFKDSEIDIVYVATPHNFHKELTIQALRSGKAVLCEKPVTVNQEELKGVIKVAEETGNYLMEGMWTYFLPAMQKAKAWVDEGRIGKVHHIKINFGFAAPFNPNGRLFNLDLAGGSLLDVGIYPIAISSLILGYKAKILNIQATRGLTGVDEDVLMLMDYDGCHGVLHSSIRYKLQNHAFIIGDEGYIQIPEFWKTSECLLYRGKQDELIDRYTDNRLSIGFNYEIDAVNEDLLAGHKESATVPLKTSLLFQEQMDEVKDYF